MSKSVPKLEQSSQAMVQTMKCLLAPGLRLKLKQPASSAKKKSRDMAKKSQIEKFRETAKAVEADDNEAKFDAALRKVAKGDPKALDQSDPNKKKAE